MNKTLKLATTAMLTAFGVLANVFTIPLTPTASQVISFSLLFASLSGMYLGAIPAVVVGFVGDLLAHFIHPLGPYNFFVALSSTLVGLIFDLIYKLKWHKIAKLALSCGVCLVACTSFLNTFGLWLQIIVGVDPSPIGLIEFFSMDPSGIKKSFWVYLIGRMPIQLLNWAVNAVILATLQQTKALDRLFAKLSQTPPATPADANDNSDGNCATNNSTNDN